MFRKEKAIIIAEESTIQFLRLKTSILDGRNRIEHFISIYRNGTDISELVNETNIYGVNSTLGYLLFIYYRKL